MTVHQDEIYLTPLDAELEEYVSEADERTEIANRSYETTVLPALQVLDDERRHHDDDGRRRIDEAKLRSELLVPTSLTGD